VILKQWANRTVSVVIATIGYILSPLSWWNDLYINIPIAYLVASFVPFGYPRSFTAVFTASYWFTNVLGLVLLQAGGTSALGGERVKLNRRGMVTWLGWSLVYTLAIVLLCEHHIIRPLSEYLQ
jgi:hypothetical protein